MDTEVLPAVYLVEDSLPLRERLREILSLRGDVRIVGEAATPLAAIDGIRASCPDVVVLDYQLDGGTGVEVLKAMARDGDAPTFIVLSNHVDLATRRACQAAGARFFLDKSTEFARICDIVADVRAGLPPNNA
jgi:DNA-binding NarL/FixJ family response regulator